MKVEVMHYERLPKITNTPIVKKNMFQAFANPVFYLYPLSFLLSFVSIADGLIPLGIAFYAAAIKTNLNRFILVLSISFGTMLTTNINGFIIVSISLILMVFFENFLKLKNKKSSAPLAICALFSVILPELIAYYPGSFVLESLIKSLLKAFAVFSLTFIFSTSINPFKNGFLSKHINNEEILGITITIILAISSFSNISILGLSIKNILFILLLLVIGYLEGAGAGTAIGVTTGLIISISDNSPLLFTTRLALCGLLAGTFRALGKTGAVLGLIGGYAIFAIYMPPSILSVTNIYIQILELSVPALIFYLIPAHLLEEISKKLTVTPLQKSDKVTYSSKIKDITSEKLNRFSLAFKELSKTFGEIPNSKTNAGSQDLNTLFDRVADRVCKDCCLCSYCWDKNFYSTYQVTFNILEKLEYNGRIDKDDIPPFFMEKCERVPYFIETVNNTYEIFKVNMLWKNKIGENKGIFSKQLEGLSSMISNLACELSQNVTFQSDIEDEITEKLFYNGVKVNDVIVYENKCKNKEINIIHKGCGGKKKCLSIIEKTVSQVLNTKYIKDSHNCKKNTETGICTLKLVEQERFSILTGVAKIGKTDSPISGDNYTFSNCSDGKYIIALSDGMGSGHSASRNSKSAINLLEQFMESGFDKDTTVNLINSILALRSSDDSFATIDLSIIDLYTGEAEFVKIGAAPSYIKKKDMVEQIKSFSLPVGILGNVEIELLKKNVLDGEFIIMISDGILESYTFTKDNDISTLKSFAEFLEELNTSNPQEMADAILRDACKNNNEKPRDDMMVIVSKIWQRM